MAMAQQHRLLGVVVSAGKMMKTVKVRIARQEWNKHIRKHLPAPYHVLVSDPADSVREGDVVALRSGWRTSRHVHHVVTSIVAPFGPPLSERPPVPTEAERLAEREAKRLAKDKRQAERGRLVAKTRLKEGRRLAAALRRHPDWKERWENGGLEERKTIRDMVEKEYQEEKEAAQAAAEGRWENRLPSWDALALREMSEPPMSEPVREVARAVKGLTKEIRRLWWPVRVIERELGIEEESEGLIKEIARSVQTSNEEIRSIWSEVSMVEKALIGGELKEATERLRAASEPSASKTSMSETPVSEPVRQIARKVKESNKEIRRMWYPVRVMERELGIDGEVEKEKELSVRSIEEIAREIKRSNREIRRMWWPVREIERELGIVREFEEVTKGLEQLGIGVV